VYIDDQQQYSLDHIPAIFVATKSDLDLAQQVSLLCPYEANGSGMRYNLMYTLEG